MSSSLTAPAIVILASFLGNEVFLLPSNRENECVIMTAEFLSNFMAVRISLGRIGGNSFYPYFLMKVHENFDIRRV